MKATAAKTTVIEWAARIAVAVVFAVNVQCALGFLFDPGTYAAAYQLEGTAGNAAVAGMGVTFLMWNATYPPVIWRPARHRALFGVVLAQQAIGLLGEGYILATLPPDAAVLAASIQRFITFDAFGLALMGAAFIALTAAQERTSKA